MNRLLLGGLGALVISSVTLAQTNPIPADKPFASEINAFLRSDQQQMPKPGGVLFVGSSTIRLWKSLPQDFPALPVINRGFGGSYISNSTEYASRIIVPYKPKIVVLFAGTNDLASHTRSPSQLLEDFVAFSRKVHEALPATRIVYLSINPTVARWNQESDVLETNFLIEKYIHQRNSAQLKLDYIDTHSPLLTADGQPQPQLEQPDGLHLNADGYRIYASIIRPRLYDLAKLEGFSIPDMRSR